MMRKRRTGFIATLIVVLMIAQVGLTLTGPSAEASGTTTAYFQATCNGAGCYWICQVLCPVEPWEGFCADGWYVGGSSEYCDIGTCYFDCRNGIFTWAVCCGIQ